MTLGRHHGQLSNGVRTEYSGHKTGVIEKNISKWLVFTSAYPLPHHFFYLYYREHCAQARSQISTKYGYLQR